MNAENPLLPEDSRWPSPSEDYDDAMEYDCPTPDDLAAGALCEILEELGIHPMSKSTPDDLSVRAKAISRWFQRFCNDH